MSGTLHVVAVPIGNPDDITLRALATLQRVAIVAAEDTRHFATLARHHGIGTRARQLPRPQRGEPRARAGGAAARR